jgi:surface polysaccharide O-acyltransferase-like enzyme
MISGALLLDPGKKEDMVIFYKKRLVKILLPVLFWSVLFLLWGALKGMAKGDPLSFKEILQRLLSGRPYYHMWFLYMIVPLYLFTPFFRKIVANSTRGEIILLAIATFTIAVLHAVYAHLYTDGSKLFITRFLSFIPFYLLGHLIRTDERDASKVLLWSVFFLSAILTALGCYGLSIYKDGFAGTYFYGYLSITVVPMSISMMYLLKAWKRPIIDEKFTRLLAMLVLGVYLVHPLVLEPVIHLGFGPAFLYPLVWVPSIALFVFCFSFLASWLLYQVPYLKRII